MKRFKYIVYPNGITGQYAYMPYGVATHTGNTITPYQWLGGFRLRYSTARQDGVYYDHTTELHLTTHRAYSADTRKWISADPLGIDGGVNVYAYANLNPLFFADPLGLCGENGGGGFWDRYLDHFDKYAIKLNPAVVAGLIGGGVMPKSWVLRTGGRGPLLGSGNQLTSVLRGLGISGAGGAIVRGGAATVGVAGMAIGTYNTGVLIGGLFYASFPEADGL